MYTNTMFMHKNNAKQKKAIPRAKDVKVRKANAVSGLKDVAAS